MKKVLDLRLIIGLFFLLTGIFLFITSFVGTAPGDKSEAVNRWCGIVYIIFSIIMLVLWKVGGEEKPMDE